MFIEKGLSRTTVGSLIASFMHEPIEAPLSVVQWFSFLGQRITFCNSCLRQPRTSNNDLVNVRKQESFMGQESNVEVVPTSPLEV